MANLETQKMVLIPEGEFLMGSDENDKESNFDEKPKHKVYLDSYYIGIYPVTNKDYSKFIEIGGYKNPKFWSKEGWNWLTKGNICVIEEPEYWKDKRFNKSDQPVVGVSWYEAEAYCNWKGAVLPTEAQWEKSARGTDGRIYPWGNDNPDKTYLNYNDNIGKPLPVGKFPKGKSPYGCYDMCGNVWEWVYDWYDSNYYKKNIYKNPKNITPGIYRVVRGGSWFYCDSNFIKVARRGRIEPGFRDVDLGFRICKLL